MAGFWHQVREHGRNFFTNWSTSDEPFGTKLRLFVRNRWRGLFNRGCCGNLGQVGC